jgi:hypothetical protein
MNELVYCKNCKHECNSPYTLTDCMAKIFSNEFTNKWVYKNRKDLNSYGQCEFYRRKWWKVWIKNN